ncbi:hypothetical protein CO046_03295 [Candidatus Peregrinibacteria bacterium CG_4_9_14_0_2_um_filter_53_11]|nr:MAG: hypothetical protein CO046_03295 [Candidatus Peregrinibacteria bacterium CG_4_9_14_0_2_um_filter_53_11]
MEALRVKKLRPLVLASTIVGCGPTQQQVETPASGAENTVPGIEKVTPQQPQIGTIIQRIRSECGDFEVVPTTVFAPGSDQAENPDAGIFLKVPEANLVCVVETAISSNNGPKVCHATPAGSHYEGVDVLVVCGAREGSNPNSL